MKLVGATDRFVRSPFMLESILYSLIATLIVAAILFPVVAVLEPWFDGYLGTASVGLVEYFHANWFPILGTEFAGLAFLNIISTMLAIRRHLRV